MPDRFLAFRMFGDFAWPPIPGKADSRDCKPGAVEIFFVRDPNQPQSPTYRACVRWTPLEKFTRGARGDGPIDWVDSKENFPSNIYSPTNEKLESAVGDGSTSFFLDVSASGSPKGEKLTFIGGDYFEQFAVPENLGGTNGAGAERGDHQLKVRIPLVRFDKDGRALTGIVIGQPENPGIRVELALPTPIPLAPLGGVGGDYGAFAFAVVFSRANLSIKQGELSELKGGTISFDTLVFGPPGNNALGNSKKDVSPGAFLFSRHDIKNTIYRSHPTSPNKNDKEKKEKEDAQRKWPTFWLSRDSGTANVPEILRRFGLKVSASTCSRIKVASDWAESSDLFPECIGLWINPEGEKGSPGGIPSFRVLNRFTLKGAGTEEHSSEDDVRVTGGRISLRWGDSKDGWHELGDRISVMADLSGDVDDILTYEKGVAGKASAIASPPEVLLETRIGWVLGKSATTEWLPGFGGIRKRFEEALNGALALEGAQPAAMLPRIIISGSAPPAPHSVPLSLRAERAVVAIEDGQSRFRSGIALADGLQCYAGGKLLPVAAPIGNREPGQGKHAGGKLEFSIQMEFPLFYRRPSNARFEVKIVPQFEPKGPSEALFFAKLYATTSQTESLASIGGLAFEDVSLVETGDSGADYADSELRAYHPIGPDDPSDLELRLRFHAARLIPISIDVPRGEQRVSPIMYDEKPTDKDNAKGGSSPRPFTLDATETLSAKNDRVLAVELRETVEGDQKPGGFVLFSEEPFGVKRAIALPLESRGGDDGTVVATYSSLDRSWHALARQNTYHYVLPPQSIGESMDKPGRLELQDTGVEADGIQFERPVPDKQDEEWKNEKWKNGVRRHAVEFRLTPPADIWVRPSDVPRRFVLPEWAAGELFVQRGEQGLGVALAGLAAEFVYGISSAVDPSKEQGPSRRARVTEVEALLGRPVQWRRTGRAATASDDTLDSRWNALGRAYATRPERLEIWADDPNSSIPFAPARFSDGARFVLRHTALHRHPVIDAEYVVKKPNPADGGNEGNNGDIAQAEDEHQADHVLQGGNGTPSGPAGNANTQASPVVEGPRFHPHGLSGGALWPVELQSVLDMIVRGPVSSSGSIEKIALSTLGGDADQTARFADNRAAIITETRGGYVQRQKLEIIGRIGVLWHRAKHVIVYERTVNPTAQFAPDADDAYRTRRPVLRKVEEYIEILQPERRYPDIEGAQPHTNAFLAGVRFNSRIIPVDSGWAEEIGTVGYAIPLWNRYAARVRPQVYRRPDVAFVLHAEGAGDESEAPQECLNPENLYFFANTSPGLTDDTDRWPQLIGVDATTLPPPCHDWMLTKEEKEKKGEKRPVETIPKGFSRFTWRLASPTARTTINAGRADTPVYTALESVTFARSVIPEAEQEDDGFQELQALAGFASPWAGNPSPVLQGVWTKDAEVSGHEGLAGLSRLLRDVGRRLPRNFKDVAKQQGDTKEALKLLREFLAAQQLAAQQEANREENSSILKLFNEKDTEIRNIFVDGNQKRTQLGKIKDKAQGGCERAIDDFKARLVARKLVLKQHLNAWVVDVDRRLADVSGKAGILAGFKGEVALTRFLNTEITQLFAPAFSVATREVGKLQRGIETARAIVADTDADAAMHIERLRADLHAVQHAIEKGKPWSDDRVAKLRQQVHQAFDKAQARLQDTVADAQHRLAVELDEASKRVAGITAHALSQITRFPGQLDPATDVYLEWKGKLESFQKKYEATLGSVEYKGAIDDARGLIEKVNEGHQALAGRIGVLIENINKIAENDVSVALRSAIFGLDAFEEKLVDEQVKALRTVSKTISGVSEEVSKIIDVIEEPTEGIEEALKNQLLGTFSILSEWIDAFADKTLSGPLENLAGAGSWLGWILENSLRRIEEVSNQVRRASEDAFLCIDEVAEGALESVNRALQTIQPDMLSTAIVDALLGALELKKAIKTASDVVSEFGEETKEKVEAVRVQISRFAGQIDAKLDKLESLFVEWAQLPGVAEKLKKVCSELSNDIEAVIGKLKSEFYKAVDDILPTIDEKAVDEALSNVEGYKKLYFAFQSAEKDFRRAGNELAGSIKRMEAWGDQAIDAIGKIGKGDVASAPNNILKALAAIGPGPELPNLDYARDRLGYYYGLVNDVVDTTPVEAWFGRLGDSLKAMGISLHFDKIGDRLLPVDLSKFDIGQVLGNFAGLDLSRLFRGIKMPKGAGEAVRLTHEFDRKAYRAWVQIDIKVEKPGRNSLFAVGPFSMDMIDARLTGFLRMEASKDTDSVEETGEAKIITDLAAMVAGQMMVTLKQVTLTYARGGGLQVDFDPKNIRISPTLRFIENTLKSLFPDDVGGMEVVKNNGIPVGLRHTYALPPMSLMFGTSGVQNIQISNQFELIAFPDFLIANRFALARPDQPFLFTIFIIGGTGWLTVDVEYRPFDKSGGLLVVVEAGAGGSASLAFSFAGVTGSVFITVSVALTYRKLLGKSSGGGLSISAIVVITGLVDVLRIARAMITVMLRLNYQDNGDIDAVGSFRITIRISRFFKISASGQARYQMKGGKKETSSSTQIGAENERLKKAEKLLRNS